MGRGAFRHDFGKERTLGEFHALRGFLHHFALLADGSPSTGIDFVISDWVLRAVAAMAKIAGLFHGMCVLQYLLLD